MIKKNNEMTSSAFTKQLKKIAPTKQELINLGFDDDDIKEYLESYNLIKIKDETVTSNPLLDLIYKYNVEVFDISMIRLSEESQVLDTENFIVFGNYDADILAISKKSEEIIILDWEDVNHIILICAKNAEAFLKALLEVASFNKKMFFDDELSENQKAIKEEAQRIAELAGGDKYLTFYLNTLGYEG